MSCVSWSFWLVCQYQRKWLTGKTRLRNDRWCVDGDVKAFTRWFSSFSPTAPSSPSLPSPLSLLSLKGFGLSMAKFLHLPRASELGHPITTKLKEISWKQWRSKALRGPGSTVTWGPSLSLPSTSPSLPFSSPFPPLPQPCPSPCREAAPKSS